MRVLVIDPDPARAALVAEGLLGIDPLEVRQAALFDEREVAAFAPDVVVIAADSPDRDTLESLREVTHGNSRPVVMFVDRSEPGLAEQAVRAGVAAYIVDGLAPGRVRPILDVAMSRFALTQQLRGDLAKAKADLESRKVVERAKGLLMKERGLDEDGAYRLLRKLAMDKGRPIGAVAADLIAFAGILKRRGLVSGLVDLRLGFIPLTDCAPLVIAKALGFFAEEGLDVTLSREASWATIRDKVTVGALDGAHMLAPMALASTLGAAGDAVAMIAPMALNLNGSAVTVSCALAEAMREIDPEGMAQRPITARPLAQLLEQRRARGEPLLTFAVVFTYSMHAYELRYWMAQAGIDPDRDIRLVVTPPPRMVEQLRLGGIDGFCVGAPWNAVAAQEGLGEVLIKASEFWPGSPDKVFGVKAQWAATYPDELRAALRAMIRASAWADDPANRETLVKLLALPEHIGAPEEAIAWALRGEIVFHGDAAGLPRREHALWFLSQMVRWGQIAADANLEVAADGVYRPDLFQAAATSLGPIIEPAMAFADAAKDPAMILFDGLEFTPEAAAAYAARFLITRLKA